MVEVYKTNIRTLAQAQEISNRLQELFAGYMINFDLEDCDRIMRIRSPFNNIDNERVCRIVLTLGFEAIVLSDDATVEFSIEG
ncbi:MAG: hypothetical protein QM762_20710 [Chryseolinea sp.]